MVYLMSASEERRRHLVRLVADHQVVAAVRSPELGVDILVAGELVQPRDGEIGFEEPVAGARRLELVVGQDDEQPGHDRLAGAGIVGEQEAQRLPRQHGFVHRGDLVRQRLDQGGVHREDGIEEVGEADAARLGYETVRGAVAVEAPGPPLLDDLDARLVVAVEDLLGDSARGRAVDQGQRLGAVPLHAYDLDRAVRENAAHGSVGLKFFELQGPALRLGTANPGCEVSVSWPCVLLNEEAEMIPPRR